jgi:hypothetical protein
MSNRTVLVSIVVCATLSASASCEPPAPPATATQALKLTPERAKAALLDMMRTKPGSDLEWFKGDIPEKVAKMKIEEEKDGSYSWTAAFRIHPTRAAYSFVVMPRPGVAACAFEYNGTFTVKDGRWIASPPKLVSTAMQGGK